MIRGTFSLYDLPVHALIDQGSTHSYVCIDLHLEEGVQIDETEQDILVTNLLGYSVTPSL